MSRSSIRSIVLAAALVLTAGLAFIAGAATAGPGEKTLAEVKDFTDRFNKVYEANDAAVAAYRIYTKMRQTDGTIVASWHSDGRRAGSYCGRAGRSMPLTSPVSASRKATRSALS